MTVTALIVAALLQTAPAARVGNVSGEVDLIRSTETLEARSGDTVSAGDRIHTSKGSSLSLSMGSGMTLQLRSETSLEIKSVNGELVALVSEGSINVRSAGKPARIETKFGQITGTEDFQEFDVTYSGDVIQVLVAGGGVRAEVSDSSKIVFKNAYDFGARVYEAGSLSPTVPREPNGTTVIIYPTVEESRRQGRRAVPILPPK
jgi:hypothetical protein